MCPELKCLQVAPALKTRVTAIEVDFFFFQLVEYFLAVKNSFFCGVDDTVAFVGQALRNINSHSNVLGMVTFVPLIIQRCWLCSLCRISLLHFEPDGLMVENDLLKTMQFGIRELGKGACVLVKVVL